MPIEKILPSERGGLYEIATPRGLFYTDKTGSFVLFNGVMVDTKTKVNLTERRMDELVKFETVDIGMFGTNSVHLSELARYGISQNDLLDGCKATYVGGWRLAKMVKKYGNSWLAVGAYHSETPTYRDRYAALIRQIIDFWIAQGVMRPQ